MGGGHCAIKWILFLKQTRGNAIRNLSRGYQVTTQGQDMSDCCVGSFWFVKQAVRNNLSIIKKKNSRKQTDNLC